MAVAMIVGGVTVVWFLLVATQRIEADLASPDAERVSDSIDTRRRPSG